MLASTRAMTRPGPHLNGLRSSSATPEGAEGGGAVAVEGETVGGRRSRPGGHVRGGHAEGPGRVLLARIDPERRVLRGHHRGRCEHDHERRPTAPAIMADTTEQQAELISFFLMLALSR